MRGAYCWADCDTDHTCMLEDQHHGPHQPTPNDDILLSLATPEDTNSDITLTVLGPSD